MKIFSLITAITLCFGSMASQTAIGDLNADGLLDRVQIIPPKDILKDRPILIITLNKKKGSAQKLKATKALFYGFENKLEIKGGIIHITYEGGARSQWVDTFKWRFDSSKNDFVLIGRTYKIVDNANEYPTEKVDANYSTGKVIRIIGTKTKSCSFDSSKKIYLLKYDIVETPVDDLSKLKKACPIK